MYKLMSQLTRVLPFPAFVQGTTPANGVAQTLMESAGARAGRNPHQAQALRRAACAYLSVVR